MCLNVTLHTAFNDHFTSIHYLCKMAVRGSKMLPRHRSGNAKEMLLLLDGPLEYVVSTAYNLHNNHQQLSATICYGSQKQKVYLFLFLKLLIFPKNSFWLMSPVLSVFPLNSLILFCVSASVFHFRNMPVIYLLLPS